jgi:hypothetical protein
MVLSDRHKCWNSTKEVSVLYQSGISWLDWVREWKRALGRSSVIT